MRAPGRLVAAALGSLLLVGTTGCGDGMGRIPLSSVQPPTIRVLLGSPREAAQLAIPDTWTADGMAGKTFHHEGSNLRGSVQAGASGIVFDGRPTGASALRVSTRGAFTLEIDDARIAYRGDLILRQQSGRLQCINELDLESYVAGVIVNEIGGGAAASSYGAQAVVARTYGYSRWHASRDAPYHVTDDQNSQVYKGITLPKDALVSVGDLERRTNETRGVVLTWRGETFPTYYSSTCGGHTTQAETSGLDPMGAREPLMGVPCRYCTSSKYFAWTEAVPVQRLIDGLKARGVVGPITKLDWTKIGRGGWVAEVTLTYGPKNATKVVPGMEFRRAAGLRSMHLESVSAQEDGSLLFKGSGWGHGVGMCQVGAQEMGRKGFAADQILRYYYPGAEFTRLY